jgi:hypothetical protein
VPKAPAENPESTGLVAEPEGDGRRRRALGEVGAQRLVLPLARLDRLEEEADRLRYRI